jgi:glycosyltransferase involved in cell wall biosynthesis
MPPISVTILTKNSQKYLKQVLAALVDFDEVLIYDTGSTDSTLPIARQFKNVVIIEKPFIGFGPTHNDASALARHDWILSIDSDEIVSNPQEVLQLGLRNECVYSFARRNEFRGKWIKGCGWYPDWQIRLYNRKVTSFSNAQVHEAIMATGLSNIQLMGHLQHYSYEKAADFLHKMQTYSTLFAQQYQGKKSSSLSKAVLHGLFAFFKSYILKRGFLGGNEGFEISIYNANTAFYKYVKLMEANYQAAQKCADAPKRRQVASMQEEQPNQNRQQGSLSDK